MQEKIFKTNLNPNIHLGEGNIKSKNTDDIMFLTWSLPCKTTCPYSTDMCRKRCFAQKNQYFKKVFQSRMKNLKETMKDTFVDDMIQHFNYHLQRKKTKDKRIFVRIHTSGDFYNLQYFKKWIDITNYFKDNDKILFQSYTKSMPILNDYMDIMSHCLNDNISIEECYNIILNKINIHFVWSIWDDTPKEYTELAKKMKLQTFTALPKDKIDLAIQNGLFLCNGDCGNCRECYTGKSTAIVIPYH